MFMFEKMENDFKNIYQSQLQRVLDEIKAYYCQIEQNRAMNISLNMSGLNYIHIKM